MTLYIAVRGIGTIAVCKSEKDAKRALTSKRIYDFRRLKFWNKVSINRICSEIYHYETFALKLFIRPLLSEELVGKIFTLEQFRSILEKSTLKDVYGVIININDLKPEVIDMYTSQTMKELANVSEIKKEQKEEPKIFNFYTTKFRNKLILYAKNNGVQIGDYTYYYKREGKLMIIDIYNDIGISIPEGCDVEKFVKVVEENIRKIGMGLLKKILSYMLNVDELQVYASTSLLLINELI